MNKYVIDVEIKHDGLKNYHTYKNVLFNFNNDKLIIEFSDCNIPYDCTISYDCKLISYLRIDQEDE